MKSWIRKIVFLHNFNKFVFTYTTKGLMLGNMMPLIYDLLPFIFIKINHTHSIFIFFVKFSFYLNVLNIKLSD